MSTDTTPIIPLSLKYYFNDKEISLLTASSKGVTVLDTPLYAHESCKIKISCVNSSTDYRRDIRWDFGDGTVITGYNAIHHYKNPGKYTITCTFFDSRLKPAHNAVTITVYVKEVIPTILSVEREYNMTPTICRNTRLFDLSASLSTTLISEPRVSARRTFDIGFETENSYFDVKNEYQYHLQPYYTFLQEINEYDYNNDVRWDKTLKPVNEYEIKYHPIYGEFTSDKNWKFYALKSDSLNKSAVKIFNPQASVTKDYRGQLNNNLYKNINIQFKTNMSEIPRSASICGKLATFTVWYKTDKKSNDPTNLYFFFNQDELKVNNDLQSDSNYINMPPLGITIQPKLASADELHPVLSLNGFANNIDETDSHIESYLKHSLYKNYTIPAIGAYFIANDSISSSGKNKKTYNLYKTKNNLPGELLLHVNGEEIPYILSESSEYYKSYDILPTLKAGVFELEFCTDGNNKIKIYSTPKLTDLNDIILPTEHLTDYNINEIISCYTPHALFDNAEKFKGLLKTILSNNNMLNYVVSKGVNFIDDNINHKTCYIDRLLPILESVGDTVIQYDAELFKNINELRDLTRILSMSYSNLFGNTFEDMYDLHISSVDSGKNIGDRLLPNDVFYYSDRVDKERSIVAIKRNGIVYPLSKPVSNFVIVEDYSGNLKFGSFEMIKPYIYVDFTDQTDEWKKINSELCAKIDGAFSLSEYNSSWLWNLLLPAEFERHNDKEGLIHRYYSFYFFNDNGDNIVRKFNFLDEKTIPLIDGRQMSYDDWNDINGFTYDCLIKVITDKIHIK